MQIIAIGNQKGGTGKTTTAAALGVDLATSRRVLLIDLDPQASLTQALGISAPGASLAEVIGGATRGALQLAQIIRPLSDRLHLAPADLQLAACELGLTQRLGREGVLRAILATVQNDYDLCLIDCPPSLGLLTLAALTASRWVIIPSLPAAADLRGLRLFVETIGNVQAELNPALAILGVILCQYDARLNAHNEARRALEDALPLLGVVPRSVRVQESSAAEMSIMEYDRSGKPAAAYAEITREIITRGGL